MDTLELVIVAVGGILAAIDVVRSKFQGLTSWGVVGIAVALLLAFGDRLF